jgi:hypothetical protein
MANADLIQLLRLRGRLQAGELLKALEVSRATPMRQLRGAGEAVVA